MLAPVLAGLLAACGDEAAGPDPSDGDTPATGARPRNVLLISIDTLRPDHLPFYGYERDTAPRLAVLAERSVVFEQAFAQAPCTAPSHMSLFTGLYPEAHGVMQWWADDVNTRLSSQVPTLASVLRDAGWRTEAYTGGGNVRPELGFDQGFDTYEAVGHLTDRIFEQAGEALERLAAGDDPFLLFVHTYAAHDPYIPPSSVRGSFGPEDHGTPIPDSVAEVMELAGGERALKGHAFWDTVDGDDPTHRQRLIDLYDACILGVDERLGLLLTRLRQLDLTDDTLIVFTADHGEEFGEHGGFRHNTTYQELLQVPLMITLPGADADDGRRVSEIVRSVDVFPTVLDLLGVPAPQGLHGRSLEGMVTGRGPARDVPYVFSQWLRARRHALRVGDWKLIVSFDKYGERSERLYDLASDPGETVDLLDAQPDEAARLRERLESLRASCQEVAARVGTEDAGLLDDETRAELEALGYLGR